MHLLGYEVFVLEQFGGCIRPFCRVGALDQKYDLMIIIGGDGSILHSALSAASSHTPVIGVNMGAVGFMAELETSELDLLDRFDEGSYWIDERSFIKVTVTDKDGNIVFCGEALNDAAVGKKVFSKAVSLRILADGRELFSFKGDGVVVSTPTGSTAYSLSAGGPVIDPSCRCLSVTPVAPHAIRIRSVVFPENSRLSVLCDSDGAVFTTDGNEPADFAKCCVMTVEHSAKVLQLVRIKDRSFYDLLNEKLI
jgi:NAD+ kinase